MDATYHITGECKGSSEEVRRIIFAIGLHPQLNGYEGETMSVEVPIAHNIVQIHERVREVVLHRVNTQTSIGREALFTKDDVRDITDQPIWMIPEESLDGLSAVDSTLDSQVDSTLDSQVEPSNSDAL